MGSSPLDVPLVPMTVSSMSSAFCAAVNAQIGQRESFTEHMALQDVHARHARATSGTPCCQTAEVKLAADRAQCRP